MPRKRCIPCGGSGKAMGGGMILADCDHCDGHGKIDVPPDEIEYLLAKNTEHYNKAKDEIKELGNLSDKEAETILDENIKYQKTIEKKGFEKKELISLSDKETEATLFNEEITNQKVIEKNTRHRIKGNVNA